MHAYACRIPTSALIALGVVLCMQVGHYGYSSTCVSTGLAVVTKVISSVLLHLFWFVLYFLILSYLFLIVKQTFIGVYNVMEA